MSVEQYKADAHRLAEHLSAKYGWHLKHAASLEAIAISRGFKDWNTCVASFRPLKEEQSTFAPQPAIENYLTPKRIFGTLNPTSQLQQLGISHGDDFVNAIAAYRNALFIVAGYTGTGISTSLNAIETDLKSVPSVKVTVIDAPTYCSPSETSSIENVWERLFYGAFREDPDVILIKTEVRFAYQVRLVMSALESGHTVVCSLHAGSARSALNRLTDMGTDTRTLHTFVRGVLRQTLLRTAGSRHIAVSECALPRNANEVHALDQDSLTYNRMIDDGLDKLHQGLFSENDLIQSFGHAAVLALAARKLN